MKQIELEIFQQPNSEFETIRNFKNVKNRRNQWLVFYILTFNLKHFVDKKIKLRK